MCNNWEICEWLMGQFPWAFVIVCELLAALRSTVGFGIRKLCLRRSDIYNFPIWPLSQLLRLFLEILRVIFLPDTSLLWSS